MSVARRRPGLAAALLLAACACVLPTGGKRTGRSLEKGEAARITSAPTTSAELIERLGPPMAIAGPGELVQVPAATVHHSDGLGNRSRWRGGGSWTQQGDAWLELFAARRPLRETHRVWYWYSTWDSGVFYFFIVAGETRWDGESELWVLVDEETGIAEDAVYRRR